ncbi:hypothetical protein [Actinoplanes sp. URMC 104]|uniref:hypothetical protein n=1 Tax=Actinoplanes sp. URMC 104 TaxID=3423409 RepID=UPI003F1951DA
MKAADLPKGSVVAIDTRVLVKQSMTHGWDRDNWVSAGQPTPYRDVEVDDLLDDGAVVLRHGYGVEQPAPRDAIDDEEFAAFNAVLRSARDVP